MKFVRFVRTVKAILFDLLWPLTLVITLWGAGLQLENHDLEEENKRLKKQQRAQYTTYGTNSEY